MGPVARQNKNLSIRSDALSELFSFAPRLVEKVAARLSLLPETVAGAANLSVAAAELDHGRLNKC